MINVLFFGPVAEKAEVRELSIPFQAEMALKDLRAELEVKYPDAFALVKFIAVNQQHARDMTMLLTDNSEVVFMSNFSGG